MMHSAGVEIGLWLAHVVAASPSRSRVHCRVRERKELFLGKTHDKSLFHVV